MNTVVPYSKFVAESTPYKHLLWAHLRKTPEGFYYLEVPNGIIEGYLSLLRDLGAKPPEVAHTGPYEVGAHVSIIRSSECTPELEVKLAPYLGMEYSYELQGLFAVDPDGWEEVDTCWYVKVFCGGCEELRKSVGLTPRYKGYDFHITVGVRLTGIDS